MAHAVCDGRMLRLVGQHRVGEARMWVHTQRAKTLVIPIVVRRILMHHNRLEQLEKYMSALEILHIVKDPTCIINRA